MYSAERYHDISAGHRVVGHENKCRHLHGHNYRIHFVCVPDESPDFENKHGGPRELDNIGRVIDFGVIKSHLAMWVEEHWDHRMLLWERDPMARLTDQISQQYDNAPQVYDDSVVLVPFNPTAENMAQYLVEVVGPKQLKGTGVVLHTVRIEETRKCSATYSLAR